MRDCDNCRLIQSEKIKYDFGIRLAARIIFGTVLLALVFLSTCWIENEYAVQQIETARGVGVEFGIHGSPNFTPGSNYRVYPKAEKKR